jgi:hypothetical protein
MGFLRGEKNFSLFLHCLNPSNKFHTGPAILFFHSYFPSLLSFPVPFRRVSKERHLGWLGMLKVWTEGGI